MPLSHTCTDGATRNSDHRDHLDRILSELGTNLRRGAECAPAEQDFERFEGEVHRLFAAAERAVLADELERLDVNQPEVTIEGRRYRRVLRASEYGAADLVPRRRRAGSGSAGVAGGHQRR